jgi:hypothetical protein
MGILGPKRHTQKTGDISEQACITRLLECGYTVLQPIGQMHRYDLVIEDADGKFWRIQVKTGWLTRDDSVILFSATSNQYHYNGPGNRGGTRRKGYRGEVDYFCVYVEALRKVYMLSVNEVGAAGVTLRLTPSKNNQEKNVRWAKDYEL